MKRWLWVLGITAVIAIITFVLSNAHVNISLEEHTERSLKIETSLANASCSNTKLLRKCHKTEWVRAYSPRSEL